MEHGPYRAHDGTARRAARTRVDRDELAVAVVVLVVGLIPVALSVVRQATWGAEAACGLLLSLVGAGWVRHELRLRRSTRGS